MTDEERRLDSSGHVTYICIVRARSGLFYIQLLISRRQEEATRGSLSVWCHTLMSNEVHRSNDPAAVVRSVYLMDASNLIAPQVVKPLMVHVSGERSGDSAINDTSSSQVNQVIARAIRENY